MTRTQRLISFIKWRVWRYTDDLDAHVTTELLEDHIRGGNHLSTTVAAELERFLQAQSEDGSTPFNSALIADQLGIDLNAELHKRLASRPTQPQRRPQLVVCILGAPRSGTTTLLDRLTYQTDWAVITDHSHHIWPTWGLQKADKRFMRNQPASVLDLDTRDSRLDPSISWPSEAENILHRYIPAYDHHGGHHYNLHRSLTIYDPDGLLRVVSEHLQWFNTDTLLLKSPFNTTRVEALQQILGGRWIIIHKTRQPDLVAASLDRVRFRYQIDGTPINSTEAVDWFRRHANVIADITIDQDELMTDPKGQITALIEQVEQHQ